MSTITTYDHCESCDPNWEIDENSYEFESDTSEMTGWGINSLPFTCVTCGAEKYLEIEIDEDYFEEDAY